MPPNIVWITLDSVRFSNTSLSDYHRPTTPRLERLASRRRSVSFNDAHAGSNWTFASTSTILTGQYPTHHTAGISNGRLPDEVTTVPERFRDAGYRTACISHNTHVSRATNLDRGFDRFARLDSSTILEAVPLGDLVRFATNGWRHGGGLTRDTRKHCMAYLINLLTKRWLREFGDGPRPFFLYLHYNDTHHPYAPPLGHLDGFDVDASISPREMRDVSLAVSGGLHRRIADGCDLDDVEIQALVTMYDSCIRYLDEMVGSLVDWIRASLDGSTVVVVTSDHGELFGERDLLAHMLVTDDPVSHVPLVVSGLRNHDGVDDERPVQHSDVMCALLRDAGAETADLPAVDPRSESREYAVTQRGRDRAERKLETLTELNPSFDAERFPAETVTTLRSTDHRFDTARSGDAIERRASGEPVDRSVRERFAAAADDLLDGDAAPVTDERREMNLDDGMRARLSELGYLQ